MTIPDNFISSDWPFHKWIQDCLPKQHSVCHVFYLCILWRYVLKPHTVSNLSWYRVIVCSVVDCWWTHGNKICQWQKTDLYRIKQTWPDSYRLLQTHTDFTDSYRLSYYWYFDKILAYTFRYIVLIFYMYYILIFLFTKVINFHSLWLFRRDTMGTKWTVYQLSKLLTPLLRDPLSYSNGCYPPRL